MKKTIDENFSEITAMRINMSWEEVALHFGFTNKSEFMAIYHQVKKEKIAANNSEIMVTPGLLKEWKSKDMTKLDVMKEYGGKIAYEAIRSAERRYGINLKRHGKKKVSDDEIKSAYDKGGRKGVIKMFEGKGLSAAAAYMRMKEMSNDGIIGKEPPKEIECSDGISSIAADMRKYITRAWA